jgi:hypothetical protein
MGDRVVLMDNGRVTATGAIDALLPKLDDTSPIDLRRGA